MIFRHDAGGLPTIEHENLGEFKTWIIKPAQLARLGRRPTCLQPMQAGGSTVNSSSQLQANK